MCVRRKHAPQGLQEALFEGQSSVGFHTSGAMAYSPLHTAAEITKARAASAGRSMGNIDSSLLFLFCFTK